MWSQIQPGGERCRNQIQGDGIRNCWKAGECEPSALVNTHRRKECVYFSYLLVSLHVIFSWHSNRVASYMWGLHGDRGFEFSVSCLHLFTLVALVQLFLWHISECCGLSRVIWWSTLINMRFRWYRAHSICSYKIMKPDPPWWWMVCQWGSKSKGMGYRKLPQVFQSAYSTATFYGTVGG